MTDDSKAQEGPNAVPRQRGDTGDVAPGDQTGSQSLADGIRFYLIGLVLAAVLTVVSFVVAETTLVWQPSIPIALTVLAIAQMGVHLVFFLHLTSGPDNLNNVMALAFGLLIVMLVVFGSLWIMSHLDHRTMSMEEMKQMQR
jgi:cytochrome o ubiquinol oxidase operon protein cyoD